MTLVTVFKSVELSHDCHLHRIEINTGIRSQKKTPDITTCCPLPANFQKSTTQQFNQDCSTVNLTSSSLLVLDSCLSCMTCSSLRSIYDPDLKLRRRHSTASPLSFVSPSANCKPVGAQRITQPVFFKDSNIEHIDGRPLVLQRCWAPNCQQMIVQTLAVCNTHWRSLLFYRWSTTQIEYPFDESQGHRHCLCFGTQRAQHCATHFKRSPCEWRPWSTPSTQQ